MTIYSVYEPAKAPATIAGRAERVVFVKDGFSWPALFVPLIWLIYQRMWIELVLLIVLLGLLQWALGTDEQAKALLTWSSLAVSVLFACVANDLRGFALGRRGYRFAGTASGRNREEAELAFFRTWLPEQGKAVRVPEQRAAHASGERLAPPAARGEAEEVIGLFPKA